MTKAQRLTHRKLLNTIAESVARVGKDLAGLPQSNKPATPGVAELEILCLRGLDKLLSKEEALFKQEMDSIKEQMTKAVEIWVSFAGSLQAG